MKKLVRLLVCSALLTVHPVVAQRWQNPQFTHLTTNEGLSQSHVNAILKDKLGFMWFATDEGLNKYDGYHFTIYKHYPEVSTSLTDNFVYDIFEDKAGIIWVATATGLDKFNRTADQFSHALTGPAIRDIFQDSKQRLWLGTTAGLYLFSPDNNTFTVFRHDQAIPESLSDDAVMKITEDDAGTLWIATMHGLNRFVPGTNRFDNFLHEPGNPGSLRSDVVRTVLHDTDNQIWAGMTGGGIARYNRATRSFDTFVHADRNPASIGHNDVLSMMQDSDGTIWVGTENGGISVYQPNTNRFTTFGYDVYDDKSLSNNSVYCLYRDDVGNVWAGTYSGGINFMPRFGPKFSLYRNRPDRNSLSNNIILCIKGDVRGYVWLGTDGGGLNRFDPVTKQFRLFTHKSSVANSPKADFIISAANMNGDVMALGYHRHGLDLFDINRETFTHYQPQADNQNTLPVTSVNTLFSDSGGSLWIGTWMHGLYRYSPQSKRVVQYTHTTATAGSISNNSINAVCEDADGMIWIGTENGLDRFEPSTNTFVHFRHDPKKSTSISSNTVNCLLVRDRDNLWVGTAGGLCLLHKKTGTFAAISEKDGLPNNVINGIVRDARGELWLTTNKGIARYNPATKKIRNYDMTDGLQGNEFKVGSVYQTSDRMLYFGGTNGLNTVNPDQIQDNTFVPPVYITDFLIFNKSVRVGDADSPLTAHISSTRTIELTHDQGVISFEFAALNYTLPLKNQYAYKLDGFDRDWNYIGNKRTATYTNLDPGEYVFRVRGSNNDGLWNNRSTALTLVILPPYWETWWFRLIAGILLLGSAWLFYRGRIRSIQAQKWALEQIVEERTERLQQEQILNKMKSQFVSTASHEFRTPLATIQSSIDLVDMYLDFPTDNGKPLIQKHLRIVENEIGKFGELLDDVLTIEKMNAGKVNFAPKRLDFGAVCDDVITTHFQARKDHRCVETAMSGQPRPVLLDEKLIRHALVNLLSNAFKFSKTNPRLLTTFTDTSLLILVSDTGIGIPAKDMPHLFETFFRAENVSTIQGTGLGLFITKQAIERHGGTIRVDSQENAGTTFTITLPV